MKEKIVVCSGCDVAYSISDWIANERECPNCGETDAQVFVETDEDPQTVKEDSR